MVQASDFLASITGLPANATPQSLTIAGSGQPTVLTNVLIGDVWLCSGQSNMALKLSQCKSPEDIKAADFPLIRQFDVPGPKEQPPREPLDDLAGRGGPPGFAAAMTGFNLVESLGVLDNNRNGL